jgi:hypothetical protein
MTVIIYMMPVSIEESWVEEECGGAEILTVFHSQLEAVDKATPRDRRGRGKISPMTIQAPGPQVEAKKKMKIAMKAICALTAEMLLASDRVESDGSGWVWLNPTVIPIMATKN